MYLLSINSTIKTTLLTGEIVGLVNTSKFDNFIKKNYSKLK